MKRILVCVVLLGFVSGSAFGAGQLREAGTLTFLIGDVYVKGADQDWRKAEFDMVMHTADKVRTGADSRCEITLVTGSVIRMDENTVQDLEKVYFDKRTKEVSVFVNAGRLWLNARKIVAKHDIFKVRTDKTVCAIRGTKLGVDTNEDACRIAVHEGEVEVRASGVQTDQAEQSGKVGSETSAPGRIELPTPVKGPHPVTMQEWVEIVRALQQITVDANGMYVKSDLDLETELRDQWVRWNTERDRLLSPPASGLPPAALEPET